jgi:uncharacterized protein YciI
MARKLFVVVSEPGVAWEDQRKSVYQGEGKALLGRFVNEAKLVRAGRFTESSAGGGIAFFTSRDAAEEFVAEDPFTRAGLWASTEVSEWIEVLPG